MTYEILWKESCYISLPNESASLKLIMIFISDNLIGVLQFGLQVRELTMEIIASAAKEGSLQSLDWSQWTGLDSDDVIDNVLLHLRRI